MDNIKFDEATQVRFPAPHTPCVSLTSPQKELATFLEREQAQARINSTVHSLTSMCWDK